MNLALIVGYKGALAPFRPTIRVNLGYLAPKTSDLGVKIALFACQIAILFVLFANLFAIFKFVLQI